MQGETALVLCDGGRVSLQTPFPCSVGVTMPKMKLCIGSRTIEVDRDRLFQIAKEMDFDCQWDIHGRCYITEKPPKPKPPKMTDHGEELIEINF